MRVEIFSDVVCPWCYVGMARFDAALASFEHHAGVEVVHRSFELDPTPTDRPTDVLTMLAAKVGGSRADAARMEAGVAEAARGAGLPYAVSEPDGFARRHGNTFAIHRVLHLAGELGVRDRATRAVMRAHFGGEAEIFERPALLDLLADAGVDRDRAAQVLDSDAYAVDVRADEQLARDLGISAVPTFVFNRRFGVSGAQPPEELRQALERAWRLPEC